MRHGGGGHPAGWGDRDWGPPYPTSITRRRPPGGKILEERVDDDGPVAGRWPRPAWGGAATGTSARVPSTEEPT